MSGIAVIVPLQVMCRLLVAAQVGENMTRSSIRNSSLAETTDLRLLPSGYISFPEIGFAYKRSDDQLTHSEARETCLSDGGQLAVIDSAKKVEKIINYFKIGIHDWYLVGLHRLHDTQIWITIDGKSTKNLPWAYGEPSGGYECVGLRNVRKGLSNRPCSEVQHYICEIALPRN